MWFSLYTLGILLLICTYLPLVRHDFWIFRVFEYPRLQKLVATIIWLIIFLYSFSSSTSVIGFFLASLLFFNSIYLAYQIFPFTPFAKKQLLRASQVDPKNSISILVFNVYEENKETQACIELIHKNNPDVFLLLETNQFWTDAIMVMDQYYAYTVKVPIENTYGMLFYSKYELIDPEVLYLVENDIPSIHTKLKLDSGEIVQIHALHPTPPVPNENPRSTERDKELLLVAKMVRKNDMPTIVIGDLNDVAWSYTTELFLKMSELLDPRRGRGYFNTFHAKNPFMRFPLDHAFVSPHFKLITLQKLDNANSDHFPIFIALQYEKRAERQQNDLVLDRDTSDETLANEKLNKI